MRSDRVMLPLMALLAVPSGALVGLLIVARIRDVHFGLGFSEGAWKDYSAPIFEEICKFSATLAIVWFALRLRRVPWPNWLPPLVGAFVGVGFSIAETLVTRSPETWLVRLIFPLAGHASYSAIAAFTLWRGLPLAQRAGAIPVAILLHMLNNRLPPAIALAWDLPLAFLVVLAIVATSRQNAKADSA